LEKIKNDFNVNLANVNDFTFPKIKNNYKGNTIETFKLPPISGNVDMESVIAEPIAVVKTRRLSNDQKIFVNLLQHSKVSAGVSSDAPTVVLGNDRVVAGDSLVLDALMNDEVWATQQDKVSACTVCC
jgi:hypothetical protein